jgi:hypothetical protein
MLDGFMGVAGLPDYPASEVIRGKMLEFFEANDFQLFTHAYSRYALTRESLDAAMNYRHDGLGVAAYGGEDFSAYVMEKNAVFSSLEELGYRLNIYQTSHLDLCRSNPEKLDRCWQYDHPNVRSVLPVDATLFRAGALVLTLLEQSKVLSSVLSSYSAMPNLSIAVHDPRVFDVLEEDVIRKGGDNYFFAHALFPHGPFAYQPDCSINYGAPGVARVAYVVGEPEQPPLVYELRNGLYFMQVECALRTLQSLIDALKREGVYDNAIVILHGDHGSRIIKHQPLFRNKALMSRQDYRISFSTLFAVRFPGSEFSVDERPLAISYLVEEFIQGLPSRIEQGAVSAPFKPSAGDAEKAGAYVYLTGKFPMDRVEIDLFEQ